MIADPEIKKQFKIIRKNQKQTALWMMVLFFALAVLIVMQPVQAGELTLTMSNPMGLTERDVLFYYANGSLQGFYNSTSVITIDTNESYIVAMRPMQTNPLEDPAAWFDNDAVPFLQSNVMYIFLMVFLAAVWLGRK